MAYPTLGDIYYVYVDLSREDTPTRYIVCLSTLLRGVKIYFLLIGFNHVRVKELYNVPFICLVRRNLLILHDWLVLLLELMSCQRLKIWNNTWSQVDDHFHSLSQSKVKLWTLSGAPCWAPLLPLRKRTLARSDPDNIKCCCSQNLTWLF